ncbi:radical SAM protein [Papillibacter cinnamivorans]|uniref:4Fe-4S single cluster domain-containing protein n=1 Tax=Papillibacter cinnamivorans DSM 12816 TaxID=1122930 RepID=A0A1W2C2E1_9FIRM|nr:radical SAM protein [Papillibacter cinnamivorans]SMC78878.1 4Fe-4S single cluster domain-containing protein [Papillibacter cinnamivorans DSM 12816]
MTKTKDPVLDPGHLKTLLKGRVPGQLIIQMTDLCNARCPQCSMRVTEPFARSRLSLDDMKRMIDAAAKNGVEAVSFTGGETFLLQDDLLEMLRYASVAGIPFTRTGTNGFLFRDSDRPGFESRVGRLAEELAKTGLRNLWISMDSADPAVHESMRGLPGVVRGIEKALPIFHQNGIWPSANLGINRNTGGAPETPAGERFDPDAFYADCRRAFRKFYAFVIEMGFTMVNACYPMSVDDASGELSAVYGATSVSDVIRYSGAEHVQVFRALLDTIPEYRAKIRIFSPRTSVLALMRQYSGESTQCRPCRGGIDFFFVDAAAGNAYPCGYRGGESFGKYWDLDPKKTDARAVCRRCDWECFRDPSELLGNLLAFRENPVRAAGRLLRDKEYRAALADDIKYYGACGYFDGRKPPDYEAMKPWEKKNEKHFT